MYDEILTDFISWSAQNTSEFKHYGVGHNGNPPGRGSGAHPYGSGERPFQHDPKARAQYLKAKNASSGSSLHLSRKENKDIKKAQKCIKHLQSTVRQLTGGFSTFGYEYECEGFDTNIKKLVGVRDRLYGLGHIEQEDVKNNRYLVLVDVKKNQIPTEVTLDKKGKVFVASAAKEGIIKQNLAKNAVKKTKEALTKRKLGPWGV